MRTRLFLALALAASLAAQRPPETRHDNVKEVLHGVEIVDPYRWLEDQQRPETRAWIGAQNAWTRSQLDRIPGRDALKRRLTELLKIDVTSPPMYRGGRYFFTRRAASQDQAVIAMRDTLNGQDQVLEDPNPLSPDHSTSAALMGVSLDGRLLAYGLRKGGEDEVTLKFLDVDTRKHLADELPRGRYSISFKPDRSGFYYSRFGKEGPRVFYHALGVPIAGDKLIFGEGYGPEMFAGAEVSDNGRWLIFHTGRGSAPDKTEIYCQDLLKDGPIAPVVNDIKARFSGRVAEDTLYVETNWDAPNGRVVAIDLRDPAREKWREVIPTGDSVLEGFSPVGHKLFATYLENVASRLRVYSPQGKHLRDIKFPVALGSIGGVGGRWDRSEAFVQFQSFHVPRSIYRLDTDKGTQAIWWRAAVPVDPAKFELKQVWYTSRDGTRVPMFLLHAKGIRLDGTNPTWLTGYGGFDVSKTPNFSPNAALWAERGGVYALANLRGGGEFGQKWHEAGRREKKQNVFDDFIAAAEWLISNRYTSPARLGITGGSDGGLLVGAALTQRPELFQAVVCRYPLLDMVRFHKFLVARWWVPEYGSSDDPEQFKYLYAYSPYHHVKVGTKYPAVLLVTGDSDTRVAPLHARKMTALLQASTGSDRPVLLLYDTRTGHSGGMPVSKQVEDATDEISFLLWQLGVAK